MCLVLMQAVLTSKGAAAIAEALVQNSALQVLYIDFSRVWDWRGREQQLTHLHVCQNKFYWN